jgi:hypothetical protein
VLPQQAQEVEAGNGGDPTLVAGIADVVQERGVDPPVVEAVPRCPDDRRDPLAQKVQLGQPLWLIRDIDVAGRRRLDRGPFDVGVDGRAEALVEEAVRQLEVVRQVAGEGQPLAVGAGEAPGERHAVGRVLAQVGVVATVVADRAGMALNLRRPSGSCSAVGSVTPNVAPRWTMSTSQLKMSRPR